MSTYSAIFYVHLKRQFLFWQDTKEVIFQGFNRILMFAKSISQKKIMKIHFLIIRKKFICQGRGWGLAKWLRFVVPFMHFLRYFGSFTSIFGNIQTISSHKKDKQIHAEQTQERKYFAHWRHKIIQCAPIPTRLKIKAFFFLKFYKLSCVPYYMLCVMCHMSPVTNANIHSHRLSSC